VQEKEIKTIPPAVVIEADCIVIVPDDNVVESVVKAATGTVILPLLILSTLNVPAVISVAFKAPRIV